MFVSSEFEAICYTHIPDRTFDRFAATTSGLAGRPKQPVNLRANEAHPYHTAGEGEYHRQQDREAEEEFPFPALRIDRT